MKMRLVVFVLFVVCLQTNLYAQNISGAISGSIQDRSGAVLQRVLVTVKNTETGFVRTLTSDNDGSFHAAGLTPGRYELKFERDGFQTLVRKDVVLSPGQELILDAALEVGLPNTVVSVEGDSSPAEIHGGYLAGWVERSQIDRLPLNGRNVFDLALLQPGVARYAQRPAAADSPLLNHGTWFSINGANVRSNSFLLDGAPVNDSSVASSGSIVGTSLGVEAIREFQVLSNGHSAEFGRVAGGIISAVTRTGTNAFHGNLFEYHRNAALDARNFFDPAAKPAFIRHQFGMAAGGPLKKDTAFFFTTSEWLRERLAVTQVSPVPDAAARRGTVADAVRPYLDLLPLPNGNSLGGGVGLYSFAAPQPTREFFHLSRGDYQLSEGSRLFVGYALDRASRTRPTSYPAFFVDNDSRNHYVTAELSVIVSPRLLSVSRFSFNRTNLAEENRSSVSADAYKVHPSVPFFPELLIGDFPLFGPTAVALFGLDQKTFSGNEDLTYVWREHSLKLGLAVDEVRLGRIGTGFKSGRFTFSNLDGFLQGRPTLYVGTTVDSAESFQFRSAYWAGYAQYQVRLRPRLYFDAGLRYEFATVPEERDGKTANLKNLLTDTQVAVGKPFDRIGNLWSPRLGFAWGVLPRVNIRGGAGVYYDVAVFPFAEHIGATGMPPFIQRVTLRNPPFPHPPLQAPAGVVSPQPLDFNLKAPRLYQYNLAVDYELSREFLLTLAYAGSRGNNLFRRGDINLAIPQRQSDGRLFFPAGAARQNPSFGAITLLRTDGLSDYQSFQAGIKKRFSRGYHVNLFYVWSRAIDEGSAQILTFDAGGGTGNVLNPLDRRAERGLADFHAKHRFLADYSFELPALRSGAAWNRALLNGWQVNSILTLSSGQPFDVFVSSNRSRSLFGSTVASGQGLDRPNVVPGYNLEDAILGLPNRYFDPAAFQLQPAGFFGNLGRNSLIGPRFANLDAALLKESPFSLHGHESALQLRIELFNVFNHPNLGFPDRVVFAGAADNEKPLPTAGLIRSTVNYSRQLQFALRFRF